MSLRVPSSDGPARRDAALGPEAKVDDGDVRLRRLWTSAASATEAVSPHTRMSPAASSTAATLRRTCRWSSTTTTRMEAGATGPSSERLSTASSAFIETIFDAGTTERMGRTALLSGMRSLAGSPTPKSQAGPAT